MLVLVIPVTDDFRFRADVKTSSVETPSMFIWLPVFACVYMSWPDVLGRLRAGSIDLSGCFVSSFWVTGRSDTFDWFLRKRELFSLTLKEVCVLDIMFLLWCRWWSTG